MSKLRWDGTEYPLTRRLSLICKCDICGVEGSFSYICQRCRKDICPQHSWHLELHNYADGTVHHYTLCPGCIPDSTILIMAGQAVEPIKPIQDQPEVPSDLQAWRDEYRDKEDTHYVYVNSNL